MEDNIKTDSTETGSEVMNCIRLAQDKIQLRGFPVTVMDISVLEQYGIFSEYHVMEDKGRPYKEARFLSTAEVIRC